MIRGPEHNKQISGICRSKLFRFRFDFMLFTASIEWGEITGSHDYNLKKFYGNMIDIVNGFDKWQQISFYYTVY